MQPVFLYPAHFILKFAASRRGVKVMPTLPSPEHGRDLLEQKSEAGIQRAKLEAAKARQYADAPYSIIKRFQESAPDVVHRNQLDETSRKYRR
jgi:hypothetical protein